MDPLKLCFWGPTSRRVGGWGGEWGWTRALVVLVISSSHPVRCWPADVPQTFEMLSGFMDLIHSFTPFPSTNGRGFGKQEFSGRGAVVEGRVCRGRHSLPTACWRRGRVLEGRLFFDPPRVLVAVRGSERRQAHSGPVPDRSLRCSMLEGSRMGGCFSRWGRRLVHWSGQSSPSRPSLEPRRSFVDDFEKELVDLKEWLTKNDLLIFGSDCQRLSYSHKMTFRFLPPSSSKPPKD